MTADEVTIIATMVTMSTVSYSVGIFMGRSESREPSPPKPPRTKVARYTRAEREKGIL